MLQILERIKFMKLLCFQISPEKQNGSRKYFGHINSFGEKQEVLGIRIISSHSKEGMT